MTRLIKFGFITLIFLSSCQKLKPESVDIPEYPDLRQLLLEQANLLDGKSVEKTVSLDDESEFNQLIFDSAKWIGELDFLKEINPNQPEYVGSFEKAENDSEIKLTLLDTENGALKSLSYLLQENEFQYIRASFHEDKDVYVHHREILMNFKNGILFTYKIDGYQKMLLKDTVWFGIEGRID